MSVITPGVIKDVKDKIASERNDILKSTDWNDFQRRKGIITGLELVLGMVKERANNPQTDGDEP